MVSRTPVNKPKLADYEKQALLVRADKFVYEFYAPQITPPEPGETNNYLTHITTRWRTPYLSFIKHFNSPGPNSISPTFELPLARLGMHGRDKWSLWFQRYNGEWIEVGSDLTLDGCFEGIKEGPWFQLH
jgi:hypothetical protein